MSSISFVSADDSVNQTLDEMHAVDNVEVIGGYGDTSFNQDINQYTYDPLNQNMDQTAEELINLSECSSIVLHVSDNEGVISVRRDSTDSANIIIESGNWGNIEYVKQYKDDGYGYFAHAFITSNGWLIGNGGITDGPVFRQIEGIASEMVVNNEINNGYLSRIYNILSGYSLGHFVIKSSDGTYGVVFNNEYHVGKLNPGEYIVCPNVYSMSQRGYYNAALSPPDAGINIGYTDSYGVNRRNLMTYHWKLTKSTNGLAYGVDCYASNDNGAGVGRSTAYMSDNVYFFGYYISRGSIPTTPNKIGIGTHIFDNSIEVFNLLEPVSTTLVGEDICLRYQVNYIPRTSPIVQFAIPDGFEFKNAMISKGSYRYDPANIVVWDLNDCDANNYIILVLKAVKLGQYDLVYSLDNDFVNSIKLYANEYGAVISAADVNKYYKGPEKLNIYLKDVNAMPIVGENVVININGQSYTRTTDDKGIASLALNLNSGSYDASITYNGRFGKNSTTANVRISDTVSGSDVVKMYKNDTQYYAKFLDVSGKPLANTNVMFNINGVFYTRTTDASGNAKLNINLNPDEYIITAINPINGDQHSNKVKVITVLVDGHDLTKYYMNATPYSIKVLDNVGNPLANADVTFNINGVFYTRTTNSSGYANLNINLLPGSYIITAMYNGLMHANTIEVLPVLFADDATGNVNDSNFTARLIDGQGVPYSNQSIKFNVNDVVYTNTTNDAGIAKLSVSLPIGEYTVISSYNDYFIDRKLTIKEDV
ncbi:Ig-like domain repeat protein [Methanobrevibacter sp.]|uniref:Ig-like domain repeat protein n=1 Tax=Methanobrevibacter sp. TaxID=66852 RepID=UPI00388D01FF